MGRRGGGGIGGCRAGLWKRLPLWPELQQVQTWIFGKGGFVTGGLRDHVVINHGIVCRGIRGAVHGIDVSWQIQHVARRCIQPRKRFERGEKAVDLVGEASE